MPNFTYQTHDDILAGWPTPLRVGMLASAPNPDGTGIVEPSSAAGYARQVLTYDKSRADGVTTITNSVALVFGPSSQPWTPVNYFGLFDANGVLRAYGRLRTMRTVDTGLSESFQAGAVQIRLR